MSQPELLRRVIDSLEAAGIDYMATGSLVSSMQGEPRSTHDIDLVVVLTPAGAERLSKDFPPPDFYLDPVSMKEAIRRGDTFNLLDITGGDKVDFWMLTADPFDQSRFARRHREDIAGISLFVSRPEDTILQKLRWSELSGGSERQFHDALSVYEIQYSVLDQNYLSQWADTLGVRAELERVRSSATAI